MRILLTLTALGLLAASPCLALTVQPAPTRDQAPHLKQDRGDAGSSLRDGFAGSGRPLAGTTYDGRQAGYGETRTFSFGSVTTSVTTGGFQDRSRLQSPMFQDRPAYLPRRR
jgi:hypothetical protein